MSIDREPSLTGRRFTTGDAHLDRAVDELFSAMRYLLGRHAPSGLLDRVLNDGGIAIERGLIYGRNASGRVAASLAVAAAATRVPPMWLAEESVGSQQTFLGRIVGPTRVRLETPSSPGYTVAGTLAWLSATNAGTVTATAPTAVRYMVGRFADTLVDSQGQVGIDLFLFPQSGGAL